jgi:hypothetical protein
MRFASLSMLALSVVSAPSLGEEEFGNAPVEHQAEWAAGVLDVANDPSRVYRRWVNGNEDFCFAGGALELERCLKAYSAVQAPLREVVLLPTPGGTRSFEGLEVDFAWRLNVPSGIYRAMIRLDDEAAPEQHATLTVHIAGAKLRLADLKLPAAVTVLGPDDVAARLMEQAADKESRRRGYALSQLGEFTYLDPVVDALLEVLEGDDAGLQPTAAAGLARAGRRGARGIARIEALLGEARKAGALLPEGREDWRSKSLEDALALLEAAESGPVDADAEEAFAKHLEALRALVAAR